MYNRWDKCNPKGLMQIRVGTLVPILIVLLLIGLAGFPHTIQMRRDTLLSSSGVTETRAISNLAATDGVNFSIVIDGFLTTVVCPIRIGLQIFASTPNLLMSGFEFYPIMIESGVIVESPVGLAVDKIFSYPYAYVNGTMNYDYWTDDIPEYEMYRPDMFWTSVGSQGNWLGAVFLDNLTKPLTIGEYLWLDGIKIYLSNGVQSVCNPSSLLLWTEFCWNLTSWTAQTTIWDSLQTTEILGNTTAILEAGISLNPLGYVLIASIFGIPICVVMLHFRSRLTKS
ncbi:MAG: hypothetical protein P1Q69_07125 [Candidatus Thorarchaeota archaeon]|nr:hypothetical protein [Candidatus Thorarchaeota archaeon]